ncbi:MAG: amidohydrolase family protein [Acidimicrobiia bacterium]
MKDFPRIVSVDDHVIEPPHLWETYLPSRFAERAPRVERIPCAHMGYVGGVFSFETGDDGPECDWWRFEDLLIPRTRVESAVGYDRADVTVTPTTYDEMRPGCYDPAARLADMDEAHIEAQLCFPSTFPRFCGQTFTEIDDHELGLACVRAYNDWMVDEWCGDSSGRLIPLVIVPLWDPALAAEEVRRNATRGVHAVSFSEIPAYLGLPSIHGDHWEPFFAACEDTDVSIHMHIGSSSKLPSTSADAPPLVASTLTFGNAMSSMVDFMLSGVLERHPGLQLSYSEGQIGWIPYILERIDKVWESNRAWGDVAESVPQPPSTYFHRQISGCFFDDEFGLSPEALSKIGADRLLFETDYPHSDSTWPTCRQTAEKLMGHLDDATVRRLVRGNAIELLGLDLEV